MRTPWWPGVLGGASGAPTDTACAGAPGTTGTANHHGRRGHQESKGHPRDTFPTPQPKGRDYTGDDGRRQGPPRLSLSRPTAGASTTGEPQGSKGDFEHKSKRQPGDTSQGECQPNKQGFPEPAGIARTKGATHREGLRDLRPRVRGVLRVGLIRRHRERVNRNIVGYPRIWGGTGRSRSGPGAQEPGRARHHLPLRLPPNTAEAGSELLALGVDSGSHRS